MKYFNDSDLFELFEFNYTDPTHCETLKMLLERDGFNITKTPTVDRHLKFLNDLQADHKITGLSLNSNLYTKQERLNEDSDVEILSEDLHDIEGKSNSTAQEDRNSPH
jgi:hypothetical protein